MCHQPGSIINLHIILNFYLVEGAKDERLNKKLYTCIQHLCFNIVRALRSPSLSRSLCDGSVLRTVIGANFHFFRVRTPPTFKVWGIIIELFQIRTPPTLLSGLKSWRFSTHLKLTADMRPYSSLFLPCRMLYTLLSTIFHSVNFVPIIPVES